MMKLMLHLMPCESGKLYFETVNGKIEIDAGTRNVFSYVPQGNMIMSGTIRENITFSKRTAASGRNIEKVSGSRVHGDCKRCGAGIFTGRIVGGF